MPPKKQPQPSNEMINFYEHKDMKKFITNYHNPHFNDSQIKHPCRIGIIASSGGGKTQWLLNFIAKMNDTFGHIYVVYKASEPLYQYLEQKIGSKYITFLTKLGDLPPITKFPHPDKQILLIFDDCVNIKDQTLIQEFFIRGRKVNQGISMCYLSQSFFKIPKLIRQQFNYLILLKLSSNRDLNLILSDFSLGVNKDELLNIYKQSTAQPFHFLKISLDEPNENLKFSHNWTNFFHINKDDSDDD
jgi:hypothetical protein